MCEGIDKLYDSKPLKLAEVASPAVSPRLQDFFKDKKEGSLKQSIISLNKTLPPEVN